MQYSCLSSLPVAGLTIIPPQSWSSCDFLDVNGHKQIECNRITLICILIWGSSMQKIDRTQLIWVEGTQGKNYPCEVKGSTDTNTGRWWGGQLYILSSQYNLSHVWELLYCVLDTSNFPPHFPDLAKGIHGTQGMKAEKFLPGKIL